MDQYDFTDAAFWAIVVVPSIILGLFFMWFLVAFVAIFTWNASMAVLGMPEMMIVPDWGDDNGN